MLEGGKRNKVPWKEGKGHTGVSYGICIKQKEGAGAPNGFPRLSFRHVMGSPMPKLRSGEAEADMTERDRDRVT